MAINRDDDLEREARINAFIDAARTKADRRRRAGDITPPQIAIRVNPARLDVKRARRARTQKKSA